MPMMDYIDFKELADTSPNVDIEIANEVKKAEQVYTSFIGDYKKFDAIDQIPGANNTDSAIRHLFACVLAQFNETERKRASQFYSEKFSEFCKYRFVKNASSIMSVYFNALNGLVNNDKLVEGIENVHKKDNEFVKYIKETHDLLKENDFPALSKYLKENRERIIKLNSKDKAYIKLPANFLKEEFIDKLDKVLDFMCEASELSEKSLKSKELNGIKRESFFEIMSL